MYSSNNLNSIHQDVLSCPIPETEQEKKTLVAEIQDRAKSAFGLAAYKDAQSLYTRAISIFPEDNLYSNRCLTYIKMDKLLDAEDDANMVIRLNPDWNKGYFRRGQVSELLGEYVDAKNYYQLALERTKDIKCQKTIETKLQALEGQITFEDREQSKLTRLQQDRKTTKNSYPVKEDIVIDNGSDDDSDYQGDTNMRGYRLKEDGSKTTFFNHEQTELEKKLIGDITPKRL